MDEIKEKTAEEWKEEIEKLAQELEKATKEKEEFLAGWQRARADLLNYKKEEEARMQEWEALASGSFLVKLLPVLDNMEIAEVRMPEESKKNEYVQGLLQGKAQLAHFLKSQGLEEMKTEGERFNPAFHEAVGEIENEGKESGVVGEVVEKGYFFNGGIFRPAKVKVVKERGEVKTESQKGQNP